MLKVTDRVRPQALTVLDQDVRMVVQFVGMIVE